MNQTAGEKKKALLELLGLDALNGLRDPLKTSCGHVKREADTARRQVVAERAAVDSQLAGEELVAYAEQLRVRAGLTLPIRQPGDILALSFSTPSAVDPDQTTQQLVDFVFGIAAKYFPRLVPNETEGPQSY